MPDSSERLQENPDALGFSTRDMHRALVSLTEELDAVDSYQQRTETCSDEDLRAVLEHNRREEIEHAAMLLAWLREHDPTFARHLGDHRTSREPAGSAHDGSTDNPQEGISKTTTGSGIHDGGFTIGSLMEDP
jgi:hypothetical protein